MAITFTPDQQMVALWLVLFSTLAGVAIALYGLLLLWPRTGRPLWARHKSFARELSAWNATGPIETAAQADEIMRQFRSLTGWSTLGYGVGWLLATNGICALALAATGSLASPLTGGAEAHVVLQCLGAALGETLGFFVGSARTTHVPPTAPTYGDLRRRRASDYRAWWLAWGLAALAFYTVAPLWLLTTGTNHVTLTYDGKNWTFPTGATVGVFLTVGALIPAIAEVCVRMMAEAPRTLRASDPQVARNADDFRRALGINTILGLAWLASGNLLQALANMMMSDVTHTPSAITALGLISYILGFGAFMMGLFLLALHGRLGLGGHLTGWRRPTARPDTTPGGAGELAHE